MLAENLRRVTKNIEKAAGRAGRDARSVRLIAVTKEAVVTEINEAVKLGVKEIGENRVRDALLKHQKIGAGVTWHLIGHLQRNKVKDAVRIFQFIHSLDSITLASAIDKEAGKINKVQEVLIEVNVSGEKTKFGIEPGKVCAFTEEAGRFPNIRVLGLMAMTPLVKYPEDVRGHLRALRELAEDVDKKGIKGVKMVHLSMGMTQDYEIAVEEGATMVRVGRAIFRGA